MRVVLDTNIFYSAILFRGNPRLILDGAIEEKFEIVSSPVLMAELFDALSRKSLLSLNDLQLIEKEIGEVVEIVRPRQNIEAVRDPDDNRVLEAAVEGKCDYIVTGDKDLLVLKKFKKILIISPSEFYSNYYITFIRK